MKFILAFLLVFTTMFVQAKEDSKNKLVIDAKQFEAFDKKGISIFTGDVKMSISKDKLNSDKLEVYMTPKSNKNSKQKRAVLKYVATGNVSFEVHTKDKSYQGKGSKVIYNPKELKYEILGKASVKELNDEKTLSGEKIILNQKTGEAKVSGSKDKPVRFIMEIEGK